jgi:hypothetical protein
LTNVGASENVGVVVGAGDGTSDGASGVDGDANVGAVAGVGQLRSRNWPCTRSCDSNKNYNLQVRMINEDLQNSNWKSLLKKKKKQKWKSLS